MSGSLCRRVLLSKKSSVKRSGAFCHEVLLFENCVKKIRTRTFSDTKHALADKFRLKILTSRARITLRSKFNFRENTLHTGEHWYSNFLRKCKGASRKGMSVLYLTVDQVPFSGSILSHITSKSSFSSSRSTKWMEDGPSEKDLTWRWRTYHNRFCVLQKNGTVYMTSTFQMI